MPGRNGYFVASSRAYPTIVSKSDVLYVGQARPTAEMFGNHNAVWYGAGKTWERVWSRYLKCPLCGQMVWIPARVDKLIARVELYCICAQGADARAEHRACNV